MRKYRHSEITYRNESVTRHKIAAGVWLRPVTLTKLATYQGERASKAIGSGFFQGESVAAVRTVSRVSSIGEGMVIFEGNGEVVEAWPLSQRQLHRKFANLDGEPESVMSFVRQYGFLGRNTFIINDSPLTLGEFVTDWQFEIWKVHTVLEVLDCARHGRTVTPVLATLCKAPWLSPRYKFDSGSTVGFSARDIERSLAHGELTEPAAAVAMLKVLINTELDAGTSLDIDPTQGAAIRLKPNDLLGAIYLHLLNEIVGSVRDPFKCPGCGKWFVPEHGRKTYCSDACKMRAYRDRKRGGRNGN